MEIDSVGILFFTILPILLGVFSIYISITAIFKMKLRPLLKDTGYFLSSIFMKKTIGKKRAEKADNIVHRILGIVLILWGAILIFFGLFFLIGYLL